MRAEFRPLHGPRSHPRELTRRGDGRLRDHAHPPRGAGLGAAAGAAPAGRRGRFERHCLDAERLRYVDFGAGSGAPPRFGQLVRFHYVGYIASEDGESLEAYDSSYERNTPYFTKHGNGLTCEGLEEALHTMRPGGRRRVLLPPSLGYSRGSASD